MDQSHYLVEHHKLYLSSGNRFQDSVHTGNSLINSSQKGSMHYLLPHYGEVCARVPQEYFMVNRVKGFIKIDIYS